MAGSKLDGIQDKVNEYLDRVEALHNASRWTRPQLWPHAPHSTAALVLVTGLSVTTGSASRRTARSTGLQSDQSRRLKHIQVNVEPQTTSVTSPELF